MYKHRVEIRDGEAIIVGHLYIPDEESDRPCIVISHMFQRVKTEEAPGK